MTAAQYLTAFIVFSFISTLLLYAILRLQQHLPWFFPAFQNTPLSPDLSLNTAVSFSTTTTWQAVRRRKHHELLQPDGGAVRRRTFLPEPLGFPLGSRSFEGSHGSRPRHWVIFGSTSRAVCFGFSCPVRLIGASLAGLAGSSDELPSLCHRDHA